MSDAPTQRYQTLPDIIARQAVLCPDATAVHWQGDDTTYRALKTRIDTAAGHLLAIANPGDRIAVLSWNSATFVELLYAIPAAGMILVPLNARLAAAEWQYQLQHSGASVLLAQTGFLPALDGIAYPDSLHSVRAIKADCIDWPRHNAAASLPAVHPQDPAWLLYTSGSTGKPKGAVLSHQSIIAGLDSAMLGRPVLPQDKYYYPFPLFHVAAHNVLLQHAFGANVMIAAAFNPKDTLRALREEGVTTLSLAPTMLAMLLDDPAFTPDALANVRAIGYGASAMPLTLLTRLQSLSNVGLCQSYGMTELCGSVAFLSVADHQRAAATEPALLQSVGVPLPTASLKIVDNHGALCAQGEAGEIVVKAAQCFSYYWQNAQATNDTLVDGWLHTGDIGRLDERGYLFIVDRKKDMIISGGENIASREVEEVLRQHPAVRECAVIGLPDAKWGERVAAVVTLATDAQDSVIEDSALEAHCRHLLAGYKIPRTWIRTDSMPVNAGGKIDKPGLRARYAGVS